MPRILITGFCTYPGPHRLGVQLEHVIQGLQRNHQVEVLCLRGEGQAHNERIGAVRVLRVATPEPEMSEQVEAFRRALRRQIEGQDYDIIHFRDGWTGATTLNMQAKHGYATVFDLTRSPMAEPVLTDLSTAKELERAHERCIKRSDLILVPTDAIRRFVSGHTELAKIYVVPPGVNVDRFDWEAPRLDARPVILYLGSLQPGCGIRFLITAFEEVANASDAILVLAGHASATFAASVERLVQELKLEGRVRMLGEISNGVAPAVIARASICVAPEAVDLDSVPTALFPTKILEYLACKRAVVAPRHSSVQKLLRDEQQAMLFDPGDPQDLARKVLLLLENSDLRNRLAHAGYRLARSSHSASGTRRSLRVAYNTILGLEKFSDMSQQASITGSITDLGLDVHVREQARASDRPYDDDTVMFLEDPNEVVADAGEVTQVEVFPLPGDPNANMPHDPSLNPVEAGDEYTDEWRVGVDGVPESVHDPERTGPMTTALESVISNVIVEDVAQQQAKTRIVQSPFASSDDTIGGSTIQQNERNVAKERGDPTQPVPRRPPPRAPRLPSAKSSSRDESKRTTLDGGSSPISDNKRS